MYLFNVATAADSSLYHETLTNRLFTNSVFYLQKSLVEDEVSEGLSNFSAIPNKSKDITRRGSCACVSYPFLVTLLMRSIDPIQARKGLIDVCFRL